MFDGFIKIPEREIDVAELIMSLSEIRVEIKDFVLLFNGHLRIAAPAIDYPEPIMSDFLPGVFLDELLQEAISGFSVALDHRGIESFYIEPLSFSHFIG